MPELNVPNSMTDEEYCDRLEKILRMTAKEQNSALKADPSQICLFLDAAWWSTNDWYEKQKVEAWLDEQGISRPREKHVDWKTAELKPNARSTRLLRNAQTAYKRRKVVEEF